MMTGCVFFPAGLGRSITGKEMDFPVHACNIEAMQDGAGRSKKTLYARQWFVHSLGFFFCAMFCPFALCFVVPL
jgi:hypothetical protein